MKFSYCTFLCFHQCSGSLNYDRLRIRIRILLLVITYGTEATGTLHQAAGTLHQSSNITRNHKTVEIKFFSMFFLLLKEGAGSVNIIPDPGGPTIGGSYGIRNTDFHRNFYRDIQQLPFFQVSTVTGSRIWADRSFSGARGGSTDPSQSPGEG
jgi:hypothetical protein